MDTLGQDLRFAARSLLRSPGFTLTAVLTLALGIGANSAIFSVVDGVLLQPLPYAEPERLVRVHHLPPREGATVDAGTFSPQDFEDFRSGATAFERLAAFFFQSGQTNVSLTGEGDPEEIASAYVSGEFFATLGVPATAGRALGEADAVPGSDRVAVLSDGLWRTRFGADPGVVGRTMVLDGEPFTVVGVMPRTFGFPEPDVRVWLPLSLITDEDIPQLRQVRWMGVVGRLAPGAGIEGAAAESNAILRRLEQAYPETNEGWGAARVETLHESIVGDVRPALLALIGTAGLVLLIACANLANLLLARGMTRSREVATRVALGASRWRLTRQLLTESALLGVAGGAAGFVLAAWTVPALVALSGGSIPRPELIRPDARVAAFTLATSLATAALFGVFPALRTLGVDVHEALKEGGRGGTGSRSSARGGALLVVAETALAVILLAGAGLMVRSLWNLTRVDTGFGAENVLTLGVSMQSEILDGMRREARRAEIIERIEDLPGVLSVGAGKTMPLEGGGEPYYFSIPGRTNESSDILPQSGTYIVTPGYFRALGIPFLSGETFRPARAEDAPPELVINAAMARRYWPGEEPVGGTLRVGDTDFRIAGVVADVRNTGITEAPTPAVYVPGYLFQRSSFRLFVRTEGDPLALADEVRRVVREVSPQQPISYVTTLRQVVSATMARPRFLTILLAIFGGLAISLAALGVYGVTAFAVGRRTREIGIRMALGADRRAVLRLLVGGGMRLVVGGLALGVPAAFALTRALEGLLYEVRPNDPTTFAAATLLLAAVGLLAIHLPARRATRVEPMEVMRAE